MASFFAGKERNGHQGFDQLVGDAGAADGRAGEGLGHFHARLRAHRRDVVGAQRLNQAGNADADAGAIHLHGFQQGGLLAPEIQFVFQQQEHFGEHLLHVVDGESIAALGGSEELSQFLQQRHVLAEALRNVGLEDFEDALFAFPSGVIPGEADDRADAGLGEDGGFQFDGVVGEPLAQALFDQAADLFRRHVRHAVFQLGEGAAQFRRQAAVARQHLPDLLQAGHLVDQAQQALLRRRIAGSSNCCTTLVARRRSERRSKRNWKASRTRGRHRAAESGTRISTGTRRPIHLPISRRQ